MYAIEILPSFNLKTSLSRRFFVFESHRRQVSGLISSAIISFSPSDLKLLPISILKSTSVRLTAERRPHKKSFVRKAISNISPNSVSVAHSKVLI